MRNLPAFLATIVTAIAVLLMGGLAHAGTATVSWTNPTTRTDGTAFPSTSIARTDVEYDDNSAFTSPTTAPATGAVTSLVINNLPAGTYYFRAFTVDTGGVKSGPSLVVSKVVPVAPPNPPTLQTVTTVAYLMELDPNGYIRLVHQDLPPLPKGEPCTAIPGLKTFGVAGAYIRRCVRIG